MEPLGHGAVLLRHPGDLRQHDSRLNVEETDRVYRLLAYWLEAPPRAPSAAVTSPIAACSLALIAVPCSSWRRATRSIRLPMKRRYSSTSSALALPSSSATASRTVCSA